MMPKMKAKRESDNVAYNKKLQKVWKEKKVCLNCLYSADKGGTHKGFAEIFNVGKTPFKENCFDIVSPEEASIQEEVHSVWGDNGVIKGVVSEAPTKKQTPEELFNEMEDFFKGDIRLYRQEVLDESGPLIKALVDVFNKNLEFVLGGSSSGRVRKVSDTKAQQYLSNLENMVKELGHMSQSFPKMPVKKYIIFRETRNMVDISGLAFMDKNIQAVAEMIEFKLRKQLENMYES